MASELHLKQKQEYVDQLTEKLKGAVSGVVVSYKGITVAEDTKLRKDLREAGVDYFVLKNTMLRRAAEKAELSGLNGVLAGSTALALSSDYTGAAKILDDYAEKNKTFEIKAGFVDGNVVDAVGVKALATMPSKEVLVAQTLRGLNAPITSFVNVLNANIRGLAVALNAIAEQKSA